jgi:hypothetical protein
VRLSSYRFGHCGKNCTTVAVSVIGLVPIREVSRKRPCWSTENPENLDQELFGSISRCIAPNPTWRGKVSRRAVKKGIISPVLSVMPKGEETMSVEGSREGWRRGEQSLLAMSSI